MSIKTELVGAIKEARGPLNYDQLSETLGRPKSSLGSALTDLVRAGELKRVGKGTYALDNGSNGAKKPRKQQLGTMRDFAITNGDMFEFVGRTQAGTAVLRQLDTGVVGTFTPIDA